MKLNEIKLWKLNIFDIMITLVVVAFVGIFAATKLNVTSNNEAVTAGTNNVNTKFIYTISIEGLSKTSADMMKIGDDVYDKVSSTYIGKISNLEVSGAQGLLETSNGELIMADVPGKIDVKMTIETDGTVRNGEYLANGLIRIMVGNLKEIKTKYLMCFGTISSINREI